MTAATRPGPAGWALSLSGPELGLGAEGAGLRARLELGGGGALLFWLLLLASREGVPVGVSVGLGVLGS